MAVTSYNGFLVELMRLIDADEQSPTDLPLATLQQCIELGERRIYKDVQSRYNQKNFSAALVNGVVAAVTVTANAAPIPDDFEQADIVHFGKKPLLPTSHEFIQERNVFPGGGDAIYFATTGSTFTFSPAVADGTALQGSYFCRLPGLDETTTPTNQLFLNEHDLFIYGVLVESVPIFKKFQEIQVWEAKYQAAVDRVNRRNQNAAYSTGRMARRPSTRLMR